MQLPPMAAGLRKGIRMNGLSDPTKKVLPPSCIYAMLHRSNNYFASQEAELYFLSNDGEFLA